jgi:hypothetical protein
MKHSILRLFAIITVLAILLLAVPAGSASATVVISATPNPAKIGQTVTITGSGYSTSTEDDQYYCNICLTNQTPSVGAVIGTGITTYKLVIEGEFLTATGAFDGPYTFVMPTTLDGGTSSVTVTTGMTLYLCATQRNAATNVATPPVIITAYTTLTVAAGAALDALTPNTGNAGTSVQISGGSFPVSTALVFQIDGTAITPSSGDSATRASGIFISTIVIPAGTAAGAHTITVTAGSDSASATFTVTAPAALNSVTPLTGPPGTAVTIIGSNFPVSTAIVFKFDTDTITPITGAATSSGGTIASVITIPASAANGAHTITVTAGISTATQQFAVTGATTTTATTATTATSTTATTATTATPAAGVIKVFQTQITVGSPMGVSGSGFTAGSTVTLKSGSTQIATAAVASDTTFQAIFNIPALTHGSQTITASDGVHIGTATFNISSAAPTQPQPLTPLNGATVKSPATFTWNPAAGVNAPITYRLQIASDKSFPASSILIDHGNITSTTTPVTFTLSEAESAKLISSALPYYWHVETVDGAQNESGWAGYGAIYVKGGASSSSLSGFPTWGYWAVGGGIALVFFLIGLWIGRRTAFYY